MRRLARLSLEIDGAFVLEAGSLAQARHQAFAKGFSAEGFDGIVIDPNAKVQAGPNAVILPPSTGSPNKNQ